MQHVSVFGYPTPPASPAFGQPCTIPSQHINVQQQQQQQQQPQQQPRFAPLAPEERLGQFVTSSLQLTGIVGTGAYGVVYSAVDTKTGVRYAVKCLSKLNADGTPLDRRQIAFQTREIRLHYLASTHANVVSILKIIDYPDCIYVVLEYCPEGDLFYNITERGQYVGKDELAKKVFLQILDAVEHCHSLGIYHRDLKPENILVTDRGETVKLADFGLATSAERSEDYGCGSTFYMSPECLDHSSRRPFYYCAPNDVWSLGVILVNLTCGRNPWKQASYEDSTYRAYTKSQDFLKTILPVSDELNDILGRIFTRNPDERITLPELRARILACSRFTEQSTAPLSATPASPGHTTTTATTTTPTAYVCEESVMDDDQYDYDHEAPLSPASSDGESTCSSDEGSLTSTCSSIEDLEDDDSLEDMPEAKTPPPQAQVPPLGEPAIYEAEDHSRAAPFHPPPPHHPLPLPSQQEYLHPYSPVAVPVPVPVPEPAVHGVSIPVQPCAPPPPPPKFQLPQYVWDMLRYGQPTPPVVPVPQLHHPVPFHHHQVPLFAHMQGCY
ncbi:ea6f4fbd-543e-46ce-859d-01748e01a957 [Thermothielavioides terrestris]|uniref:Autophagy-related protein 1 n=1 Tax=Thermothielavioides terrestris TaxID=2587410 RepID=A0A446BMV9_9PEZI|nr:ea6f4fbd-543e-46ce-859d-01748e01a957 [Thermothielavioides terrestris]